MKLFSNLKFIILMATVITTTDFKSVAQTNEARKVSSKELAPDFLFKDVYGNAFSLSDFRGKKVLLTFYRNVGCPVCNLRFHELQEQSSYFKKNNIVLISVYESSSESLKQYLTEEVYSAMVPDPTEKLYNLYKIDRSFSKMMNGLFHGAFGKMNKGKKLFKDKVKQDGNTNRIGADFLIDENGRILISHYHKYLGDDLSIAEIKKSVGVI
jgi:thioredoxin-dependent peroxiredoxin